jgi:hypothetical protein
MRLGYITFLLVYPPAAAATPLLAINADLMMEHGESPLATSHRWAGLWQTPGSTVRVRVVVSSLATVL